MSLLSNALRQMRFGQVLVANGAVNDGLTGTSLPRKQTARLQDTVAYVLKTPAALVAYEQNPDGFDFERAVNAGQALKFEQRADLVDLHAWETAHGVNRHEPTPNPETTY